MSVRDVKALLARWSVEVSYETIRQSCEPRLDARAVPGLALPIAVTSTMQDIEWRRVPRSEDARPLLDAGYEAGAIREIAAFAMLTVAGNRMSTLPALPLDFVEHLPDRWYARVLRPLIGRQLRRTYRHGVPTTLTAEEEAGPYAYVVRSLKGLPLSRTLRDFLDDAWSSVELTRRQRALIFAVIARGLGTERAEATSTNSSVTGCSRFSVRSWAETAEIARDGRWLQRLSATAPRDPRHRRSKRRL